MSRPRPMPRPSLRELVCDWVRSAVSEAAAPEIASVEDVAVADRRYCCCCCYCARSTSQQRQES